jgi:hypothetical protein
MISVGSTTSQATRAKAITPGSIAQDQLTNAQQLAKSVDFRS